MPNEIHRCKKKKQLPRGSGKTSGFLYFSIKMQSFDSNAKSWTLDKGLRGSFVQWFNRQPTSIKKPPYIIWLLGCGFLLFETGKRGCEADRFRFANYALMADMSGEPAYIGCCWHQINIGSGQGPLALGAIDNPHKHTLCLSSSW